MPLATPLPEITAPPLACDCHLHVFGNPLTYPYSAERRNTPPALPLAAYLAGYQDVARRCGIERMVFTQPSTYGRDNRCLLDAIALCDGKARGIVDIDEHAPDAEWARLAAAGVVSVRINLGPPNRSRVAGLMEKHRPRRRRLNARCAEIGWQLDILSPRWLIVGMLNLLNEINRLRYATVGAGILVAGAQSEFS